MPKHVWVVDMGKLGLTEQEFFQLVGNDGMANDSYYRYYPQSFSHLDSDKDKDLYTKINQKLEELGVPTKQDGNKYYYVLLNESW